MKNRRKSRHHKKEKIESQFHKSGHELKPKIGLAIHNFLGHDFDGALELNLNFEISGHDFIVSRRDFAASIKGKCVSDTRVQNFGEKRHILELSN